VPAGRGVHLQEPPVEVVNEEGIVDAIEKEVIAPKDLLYRISALRPASDAGNGTLFATALNSATHLGWLGHYRLPPSCCNPRRQNEE
jgi:hypothetical protein